MARDIVISRSARNEEIMTCDIVITRPEGIVYIESLPSVVVIIIEFILHSFILSTGYEPGGCLILSLPKIYLSILYSNLLHHPTMSTNTASSTPAVSKTKYGDVPFFTALNYNSWQRTFLRIPQEINADEIISSEEDEVQPLDINYKDYKKRATKAANRNVGYSKTHLDTSATHSGKRLLR